MKAQFFLLIALLIITNLGCNKKQAEHHLEETEGKKIHFKKDLQESMGIKTISVQSKKLQASVEAYGTIAQDTENTVHITAQEAGVLKSFHPAIGDTIEKDASVAVVLNVNKMEIEIPSPIHGIVMAQYVKQGEKVDNLTSIATIANPDRLRASFDVYEKDIAFVQIAQKVLIKTIAYPDKDFEGKVVFVSPRVDPETRTVKIRVEVENQEHFLKFGMSVTGLIFRETEKAGIVIPLESIHPLDDGWVVFVKIEDELFEMREVEKGQETEDEAVITGGLKEGETIVQQGSFTLKAEAMKNELAEGGHDD